MSKSSKSSQTSWLLCAVFIVFLIMKLAEIGQVKDWNWWWVTSPLWGGLALGLAVLILAYVAIVIVAGIKKLRKNKRHENTCSSTRANLKTSKFQQRLDDAMKQREENRKNNSNNNN